MVMTARMLAEPEGYILLKHHGLPVPEFSIVRSRGEVADAAEKMGYPLVMKVISPQITHKSDAGGVVTGITSVADAEHAYDTILRDVKSFDPAASISGIILEEQKPKGLEILVGGRTDPTFGKVITVGMGGTLVELIRDASIRILPVSSEDIDAMIQELQGYPLIRGFRNERPRDKEGLIALIDTTARFFMDSPDVVEFDLNPVFLYEKGVAVVDARIFVTDDGPAPPVKEKQSLPPGLLNAKSIAVIGATPEPPATVDIAVVVVPARFVPQVVKEAGEKGIPLVIIISSGFRESGKTGSDLESEVLEIAAQNGTRIMGPNCLGLMLPHQGINTTFDPVSPKPGSIAFISQSGAIISTIVDWSLPEEIGFSAVISIGNQGDLSFEDFLVYARDDPHSKAVILYIEEIREGKRFMEIAREVTLKKPVVAIKSGSSRIGRMTAASHTGSLSGSYEVYMTAFWESGIIPVRSMREAFQTAELLASEGYPKGIRAIVISNAGGFAVLSSDYAERFGIQLVDFPAEILSELDTVLPADWNRRNPIDMVGDASADRFAKTFDIMIKNQDAWDIAFVIAVPSAISDPLRVANELVYIGQAASELKSLTYDSPVLKISGNYNEFFLWIQNFPVDSGYFCLPSLSEIVRE